MDVNALYAIELIEKLELKPPIDLYELCKVFNIEIVKENLKNAYAYFRIRNGRKVIFLSNSIVGTEKEKFTIAHELGHYFLPNHLEKIDDMYTKTDYMYKNKRKKIETDVDKFAAELIMPSKFINPELEKISLRNFKQLEELAQKYQVSLTSLLCRYVDLNSETMALLCYENDKQKWQYKVFDDFRFDIYEGKILDDEAEKYTKDTLNNWLDENFQGTVYQVIFDLKKYNMKLVLIQVKYYY
ncbi:MAG: ImmA/IrrE family metallo-endopeptidase [Clostridia bacterium]|nr:ImmA/IrrE family metallo-endopeptidase [Clostridia bacterium]